MQLQTEIIKLLTSRQITFIPSTIANAFFSKKLITKKFCLLFISNVIKNLQSKYDYNIVLLCEIGIYWCKIYIAYLMINVSIQ